MNKTEIVQRLLDERVITAEEAVVLLKEIIYVPMDNNPPYQPPSHPLRPPSNLPPHPQSPIWQWDPSTAPQYRPYHLEPPYEVTCTTSIGSDGFVMTSHSEK